MNNVTKNNFDVLRLPREALTEDRGYSACATPFKALADVNDVAQWKNDIWGVSGLFDDLTVELERPDGSAEVALGAVIDLPKQPNAKAFVIDWRSNLIAYGAGCYKVKVNWTIQGVNGHYYDASFDLLPYSVEASEGTVQLIVNYDDKVRQEGINYTGSGYYTSLRFNGFFGNEQLNSEHRNVLKSNNIREKIRNFSAPSYSLVTRPLNRCFTRPLKKFLLNASNIWISDYNAWNHEIYRYFNCILSDAEGIEIEGDETYVRQFNVTLLDKQWVTESKYDLKEAQPPAITSIISQGGGVCPPCPDTPLQINSEPVGTFPSGATIDVQLTDGTDPITPEDVSVVGNTVTVEVEASSGVGIRKTAKILKTGQTTSYRTGDDGDIQAGRDDDFFTLDSAPIHNDGSPTINTTTNRFTDILGGQDYADNIVLDWSTWDGSTLLGYYLGDTTQRNWDNFIDWGLTLSIGSFSSGWKAINISEWLNIWQYETTRAVNYAPFNSNSLLLNIAASARFLWSSTTNSTGTANAFRVDLASWAIQSQSKANNNQCVATRYFSLSTSNILS